MYVITCKQCCTLRYRCLAVCGKWCMYVYSQKRGHANRFADSATVPFVVSIVDRKKRRGFGADYKWNWANKSDCRGKRPTSLRFWRRWLGSICCRLYYRPPKKVHSRLYAKDNKAKISIIMQGWKIPTLSAISTVRSTLLSLAFLGFVWDTWLPIAVLPFSIISICLEVVASSIYDYDLIEESWCK